MRVAFRWPSKSRVCPSGVLPPMVKAPRPPRRTGYITLYRLLLDWRDVMQRLSGWIYIKTNARLTPSLRSNCHSSRKSRRRSFGLKGGAGGFGYLGAKNCTASSLYKGHVSPYRVRAALRGLHGPSRYRCGGRNVWLSFVSASVRRNRGSKRARPIDAV